LGDVHGRLRFVKDALDDWIARARVGAHTPELDTAQAVDNRLENDKSPASGAFAHAPKRTRTSTRLSRTRPSTWRVYQFRHRRG
jgi:hypothetical protein